MQGKNAIGSGAILPNRLLYPIQPWQGRMRADNAPAASLWQH
jgi:hypothetical protein